MISKCSVSMPRFLSCRRVMLLLESAPWSASIRGLRVVVEL